MEIDRIREIVMGYEDGTEDAVEWLLKKYKTASYIISNPYTLVLCGISF